MIAVRHLQCGEIAYRLRCSIDDLMEGERSGSGVILTSSLFVYDDSRPLIEDVGQGDIGTIISCQACGRPAGPYLRGDAVVADSDF